MLRGGAFKPRTSPYDFQGLREEGLVLLAEAREKTGLPIITEVKDTESLEVVAKHADVLQIGARNMQNFSLLEAVGARRPAGDAEARPLLDASRSGSWPPSTSWRAATASVILCERGIRTFETATRNTLDLGIVPLLRELSAPAHHRRPVARHRRTRAASRRWRAPPSRPASTA